MDIQGIIREQDKLLIEKSIEMCNQKFYRACYLATWLLCIENLKFKFNEAKKKSKKALDIWNKIRSKEGARQSTDMYILERAKDYYLISDIEFQELNSFYTKRCIFAHPYEKEPTELDCKHLIEKVIIIVLSKVTFPHI